MPRKGVSTNRGDTRSDGRTEPNVPVNRPGNRKADSEWGTKQYNRDMMERIGEEEFGIPFGAQWRWKGSQDDFEMLISTEPIFTNRSKNPCSASSYVRDREGRYVLDCDNNVLYRPCMRAAMSGADVCTAHGGKLPATKMAARRRLEGASDLVVSRMLQIALDSAGDPKVVLQACVQVLDRAGIKGGSDIDVNIPGWQEMLKGLIDGPADA
jgi:hypothetical protein